ncbi:MAG TPA: ATP-binding cassette domain-containing protein [Beijerinckiaceae bacterium]|jgi:ATP-binding cassette subfamily C protein|nr:ATP-binding cassette domain-containing protein [Beijerinckiaceae bacterium]
MSSSQRPSATDPAVVHTILERTRQFGKAPLRRVLGWQVMRTVFRLGFAAATALLVGRLIMGAPVSISILATVPLFLALATAAGLMAERTQAQAETELAAWLRAQASEQLRDMPARTVQSLPVGGLIVSLQRHPDAIAALVIGQSAARSMMAVGPLIAAATIAIVSWQAALTVLALTPIMIIFFVLIGDTIRRRAETQEKAFSHLAGQFADRIRALPTIVANHAILDQEAKLRQRLEAYAHKTMGVLKVAFLNAGIIDFFASLSIAFLAVLLGLGHLKLAQIPGFSHFELWQSLFILMVAPEYFAPFRRFAEQYHIKAEGLAAASALDRLLATQSPAPAALPNVDRILETLALPAKGLVAISGPSGSGKSTLLRRLIGLEAAQPRITSPITWVATDSFIPPGKLTDALAWGTGNPCPTRRAHVAKQLALLDDALLPGGLDALVDAGGANLSGGQRVRVAVARALLTDATVMADEPTAKLDSRSAALVRKALREAADKRLVVVATHDEELLQSADQRIDVATDVPLAVGVAI